MFKYLKKTNAGKLSDGPLISVVMPLYNHERFVRDAIESVLEQTYSNIELIVIDDGSKDDSLAIAEEYKYDGRFKLYTQENSGAHNAINRGLSYSRGEYLAIINSDDIFEKKRFEIMMDYMLEDSSIGFCCSYITVIDDLGKKMGVKHGWRDMLPWDIPRNDTSLYGDDFARNLLMSNFTSTTSNFLFKRQVYEEIGGMRNLRFAHDWDFALRVAEKYKCVMVEKPLMRYRVHGNNTISSNRKWMLFEIAWVIAANIDRFYGKCIYKTENEKYDMISILNSLNFQGNDKVFWAIKMFIEANKEFYDSPEEVFLDDNEYRDAILKFIIE